MSLKDAAAAATEEHPHSSGVSETLETDPWLANWDPTVTNDSWGFSNMSDGQANGLDNWPFFPKQQDSEEGNMENAWSGISDKWSTQDLGGTDNIWGEADHTSLAKNLCWGLSSQCQLECRDTMAERLLSHRIII